MRSDWFNAVLFVLFVGGMVGVVYVCFTTMLEVRDELFELKYNVRELDADVEVISVYMNLRNSNFSSNNTSLSGNYFVGQRSLVVFGRGQHVTDVILTSLHEAGHYLWYEHLQCSDRVEYEETVGNTTDWVSLYARENVREDFAETFATGFQCGFNLSRIPEDRKHFFNETLKSVGWTWEG